MNVRRCIAAVAVLVATPVLSSCGASFGAQTDQVYNPSRGVDDRDGEVDVLNALVVTGADGSGTLVATFVDNDQVNADSLTGVAGAGQDAALTGKVAGDATIPAAGVLNLATQGDVTLKGKRIVPGNFVKITFSFDRAGSATLDVPVVSSDDPDYADVKLPAGS
ncbi:MAG: hypothetical protein ABIQ59_08910 [Nocardioidaceae bacterium]